MEITSSIDMKIKRFILWFFALSVMLIIWKLNTIESDIDRCSNAFKDALISNKDQLQLTQHQLILIEQLYHKHNTANVHRPTIYAITPTYKRYVQKAELTRISQTLSLVPNVHWIVVEDSDAKTDLVRGLLNDTSLMYTHLNAKTPPFEQLHKQDQRWKKHRGVEQRNAGLRFLRDNFAEEEGVVYFMDDDNTYHVKLFEEISKVKHVGVWPVGLVGGLTAELPLVSRGKVYGFKSGWKANREYAIDMAGFAINLRLIITHPEANFSYKMKHGLQESEFLSFFVSGKSDLEPLADNCTKVYVWHTRTEAPTVTGVIPDLEV